MNRLFLVEGLPCSGKSSLSAFTASVLEDQHKTVCFVDEGSGDHPADYEFHALAPAGLLSEEAQIVPLSVFSGEMFEKLLPYKIYDFLPWDVEKPLMLDKWRQFVREADPQTFYVFNCVFLQNPMCETMMRFGFSEDDSLQYIQEIARIIAGMEPAVIYLKNSRIADSVREAAKDRGNWLEEVIAYHANGAYGKSIGAEGFDGYIACLEERQARELRILDRLPVTKLVVEDPWRDWGAAKEKFRQWLKEDQKE